MRKKAKDKEEAKPATRTNGESNGKRKADDDDDAVPEESKKARLEDAVGS